MKPIAKVAIGCGVALVLAGIAAAVLVVGGAYWVKGKVEQVAGHEQRIQDLKKKAAAAAPFTRPADDVIQEPRLVKFLEIRKSMFAIYERHRPEIEAMSKKEKGDLSDAFRAIAWINELRNAHAQAQADVGMGDEEYAFLVEQVYRSAWAAELANASGDPSASAAAATAVDQVVEAGKQAQKQLEGLSEEQKKQVEDIVKQATEAVKEAEGGREELVQRAKALEVPKANLELFRKYEADIKKYAMGGLEWLAL